jgi:hypothetical protein
MGRFATPVLGVDWAHNMALVETLYSDGGRDITDRAGNLGEVSAYPDGSEWAVVYLAKIFRLNPLQSIQILVGVLCLTASFLLTLKWNCYVWAYEGNRVWLRYALVVLWGAFGTYMGLNAAGHTAWNFFFAQLFGSVIAIGSHYLLQRVELGETAKVCCIIAIGGILLPNIHLIPAVWFVGASILCLLASSDTPVKGILTSALALGIIGACWWTNASVWAMIKIAQNNGDFVIRSGIVRSARPTILSAVLALVCTVWALSLARRSDVMSFRSFIRQTSGLLAVIALILLQAALTVFGRQSTYSVAKYLYFLCFEVPAVLVFLPILVETKRPNSYRKADASFGTAVALTLLFICQDPFASYGYDQTRLMAARARLLSYGHPLVGARKYPELPGLTRAMDYYLAIGLLRIPRDPRTERWFVSGSPEEALPVEPTHPTPPPDAYDYQLRLLNSGSPAGGGRLPAELHFTVVIPSMDSFTLATSIPTIPGEVALGYRALDKSGAVLYEGRSLLARTPGTKERFDSQVDTSTLPPRAVSLAVGIVEENVAWFNDARHTKVTVIRLR